MSARKYNSSAIPEGKIGEWKFTFHYEGYFHGTIGRGKNVSEALYEALPKVNHSGYDQPISIDSELLLVTVNDD